MRQLEEIVETRSRIGLRVKELRKKRGLTQDELGSMVGLHRSCVSRLEKGALNVTIDTLIALADAYGLTLSELLAEVDDAGGSGTLSPLPLAFSLRERATINYRSTPL